MRFVDLLKENAQWESDYGKFSRFCLDRSDVRYYTSESGSYLRDKNPANNDFPVYSNEARNIYAWVMLRCPQWEDVYHALADEYRRMKEGRRFEDMRKPEPPQKKETDFGKLARQAGKKKYIYGRANGHLTERNVDDDIQETDI